MAQAATKPHRRVDPVVAYDMTLTTRQTNRPPMPPNRISISGPRIKAADPNPIAMTGVNGPALPAVAPAVAPPAADYNGWAVIPRSIAIIRSGVIPGRIPDRVATRSALHRVAARIHALGIGCVIARLHVAAGGLRIAGADRCCRPTGPSHRQWPRRRPPRRQQTQAPPQRQRRGRCPKPHCRPCCCSPPGSLTHRRSAVWHSRGRWRRPAGTLQSSFPRRQRHHARALRRSNRAGTECQNRHNPKAEIARVILQGPQ